MNEQAIVDPAVDVHPDVAAVFHETKIVTTKPIEGLDINALIRHGMEQKIDIEQLRQMFELAKEMEAERAKREFTAAMANFQRECPPVLRKSENGQFHKVDHSGRKVPRRYADLSDIMETVSDPLARNGLSCTFGSIDMSDAKMTLCCVVSHVGGHTKEVPASVPLDFKGGANEQQKVGIAITYCQRYSVVCALGLWSVDVDEDGNSVTGKPSGEALSEEEVNQLEVLIMQCPEGTKARVLKSMKAGGLEGIPKEQFKHTRDKLVTTVRTFQEAQKEDKEVANVGTTG